MSIENDAGTLSNYVETDLEVADTPKSPRRIMLTGSSWMSANVAIQAIGNFAFMALASRRFSQNNVGLAAGLFSALALVNFLTGMGLPISVPIFAGTTSQKDTTAFTWALLYTTVTSAIGAMICVGAVSLESVELIRNESGAIGWFLVFFSIAGASLGVLMDMRFVRARRWGLVIARSTVVGVGRIALIFVIPEGSPTSRALWLCAIGALPVPISGVFAVAFLRRAAGVRYRLRPIPDHLFKALRFASVNFLATLSSHAPIFVLPVIVAAQVEPAINGRFYMAWGAAGVVFLFPTTISYILLSESTDAKRHEARARYLEALGLSFAIVILATVISIPARPLVTMFLGESYSETARILPALFAACIPWAFTANSLARARLRRDYVAVISTTISLGAVVIGSAVLLVPESKLDGAVNAWFIGQSVGAFVAFTCDRRYSWLQINRAPRASHVVDLSPIPDPAGATSPP